MKRKSDSFATTTFDSIRDAVTNKLKDIHETDFWRSIKKTGELRKKSYIT